MKPKVDKYGIKEYPLWWGLVVASILLYLYIYIMAFYLLEVEQTTGNIKLYKDAFWVLQMSSTTIGFGDFYPVTQTGRVIVVVTFYIGMTLVGCIVGIFGAYISKLYDNSIQNRELRQQNETIIQLLKGQSKWKK